MHRKIKSFMTQSIRVWKLLRKPSRAEYTTVAKVSAIGVLAMGLIGFLISTILKFFF